MNHEIANRLQERLNNLRDQIDRSRDIGTPGLLEFIAKWQTEATAIEDMLVGDDPLVRDAVNWLNERYKDSDLVLRQNVIHSELGGMPGDVQMRVGGNEHWAFADVLIGDDYGHLDFTLKHAIWRNTGALYRVERDGSVADDPIYVPEGSPYTGPTDERGGLVRHR